MREVTQRPIKFAGVGGSSTNLSLSCRIASRAHLGMGDIVDLVEKAAEAIDEENRGWKKTPYRFFRFQRFSRAIQDDAEARSAREHPRDAARCGQHQDLNVDEQQIKRTEAIVLSMTDDERRRPDLLNARRRQRIARAEQRDPGKRSAPAFQSDAN
jgi:signal recognition particle subunit SRP54